MLVFNSIQAREQERALDRDERRQREAREKEERERKDRIERDERERRDLMLPKLFGQGQIRSKAREIKVVAESDPEEDSQPLFIKLKLKSLEVLKK